MQKEKGEPGSACWNRAELRQRAEQEYAIKGSLDRNLTSSDKDSLLHELEVHQIELEMQNEELRRAQQELQESRDRYSDLFDFAPIGYFALDNNFLILEVNLAGSQMLGLERSKLLSRRFTRFVASDSQDVLHRCLRKKNAGSEEMTFELEMRRDDASLFDAEFRLSGFTAKPGNPRYRLAVSDITPRKAAEEALAKAKDELEIKVTERTRELAQANQHLKQYGRRITQVQEEERKRIAFELHDDTAQYLSILKLEIEALLNSGKIQSPEVLDKLEFLRRDAERAFNDVRRYSHELRPGVLEHLGLSAALEQIADDINKLNQTPVELFIEGVEPELSEEVKLAFFRIAQEALNNIRKHAQASKAIVDLRFNHRSVWMAIGDNGVGFKSQETFDKSGSKGSLGLMSMRERANLINADLKIESESGKGTKVILTAKV
jgi:PAS domain S-box-containing protein